MTTNAATKALKLRILDERMDKLHAAMETVENDSDEQYALAAELAKLNAQANAIYCAN